MTKDILMKKSKISGKGVFALRDFKKGEVVLKWNPKPIKKSEINSLTSRKKTYIVNFGKKYFLMQSPERYVNLYLAYFESRIYQGRGYSRQS